MPSCFWWLCILYGVLVMSRRASSNEVRDQQIVLTRSCFVNSWTVHRSPIQVFFHENKYGLDNLYYMEKMKVIDDGLAKAHARYPVYHWTSVTDESGSQGLSNHQGKRQTQSDKPSWREVQAKFQLFIDDYEDLEDESVEPEETRLAFARQIGTSYKFIFISFFLTLLIQVLTHKS